MTTSKYLNQLGIAKVSHDPCYSLGSNHHRYAIHILPKMVWDPVRVPQCFPSREAAETHLRSVYDKVELVGEKKFNALARNLSVLPRDFSNCH